jgi:hypothetical protein
MLERLEIEREVAEATRGERERNVARNRIRDERTASRPVGVEPHHVVPISSEVKMADFEPVMDSTGLLELSHRGAEQIALKVLAPGQIKRAQFFGEICLVRIGPNGGLSVKVNPKLGEAPQVGVWQDSTLVRDERFLATASERFRHALAACIRARNEFYERLEPDPSAKTTEDADGLGAQLAVVLRDHIGEDNLFIEKDDGNFIIRAKSQIHFPYQPGLLFNEIHHMLTEMAMDDVDVTTNTTDELEAKYGMVPFRESGYLLYEMGVRRFTKGEGIYGTVDVKIAYDHCNDEFQEFMIKVWM